MESQLVREQEPNTVVGLRSVAEGEDESPDHEKKSVLKKVRDKAKKLRETIAKHAHGHEHDRHVGNGLDDHDLDEEDEEMVTDPEVYGAPIYESAAVVTGVGSCEQGRVKNPREEVFPSPANTPTTTPHFMPTAPGVDRMPDRTIENFIRPFRAEEDPQSPTRRNDPANYQTKVSDPSGSGSEEVDVLPLIQFTRTMTIESEPESRMEQDRILTTGTGSHDQFSPEYVMESDRTKDDVEKPPRQGSYTEKIISATAAVADKVGLAKDIIASKLGYSDKDRSNPEISKKDHADAPSCGEETLDRPPTKGIASAVTEKLSPVYNKVMETGSVVVSKVRGRGLTVVMTDESPGVGAAKSQDKGVSVKDYLAEKLKPGEEDKALSEVISDALNKKKEEVASSEGPPLEQSPRPRKPGTDPEIEFDADGGGKERREERALQESTI